MLEQLLNYANGLNANAEVVNWIQTTAAAALKKPQPPSLQEFEHILDYLMSDKAPKRLQKMSIKQAKESTEKWVKTNQKKGRNLTDSDKDIEVLHEYLDGSKIVKLLTEKAYKREGFFMSHCVGGYTPSPEILIYSYRDAKNNPHATFEVRKSEGQIMQIKGKGNGPIHPRYIEPILAFLQLIGQQIRPTEMKNLGYYVIDKAHHELAKSLSNKTVMLHGELYAFA